MDVVEIDTAVDPYSFTGFVDIEQVQPWIDDHQDLYVRDIHDLKTGVEYLKMCMVASFQVGWNPKDKHLLSVSGGKDSRFLVKTLMMLGKVNGDDWLGDYFIVSHEEKAYKRSAIDSSNLFKRAMKELGVPEDRYMVYNEPGIGKEDYFGFDHRYPPNAYDIMGTDMSDCVDDIRDWVLVMGSFGSEMMFYPAYKPRLHNRWQDLLKYFPGLPGSFARTHHNMKGFFQPYLYRHYIDTVFRFDDELFRSDDIRDGLLGKMETPYFFGHSYNLAISQERKEKIRYLYHNSRFYDRYSDNVTVRDARPWDHFYDRKSVDGKLFGLAMTYEEGKI